MAGAVVFWGLSFVATKAALETIPPFVLIFIRFSIAAALYCLIWAKVGFPSFSRRDWVMITALAIFEPGLYFVFETLGLQYTGASKAALIIAAIPVLVLILAFLALREKASALNFIGVAASLGGIVILVAGGPDFEFSLEGQMLGDILIFGAAVSASLYIVLARSLGARHSALTITGMQAVFGAVMFSAPFAWVYPDVQWSAFSTRSLWALAYLTIFATIAAFLCWNFALTKIRASSASTSLNGVPVVAAAGAWVILGESLTPAQIGGGVLVLCGVYLANFRR